MSSPARILIGLAAGLVAGFAFSGGAGAGVPLDIAATIGSLWLDALKMTIVPLIFCLVVTGIASAASSAGAGALTRRVLTAFALLLFCSAVVGLAVGTMLLGAWSPPRLDGLLGAAGGQELPHVPAPTEWLRGLVPTNVVAAASEGAIVQLTLFALLFGLAAARLTNERGRPLLAFFAAGADAMLLIVKWVLLLAPVGVFALSFSVAARIGLGAGAVIAWYVLVQIAATLCLGAIMYPLAMAKGGVGLKEFARAAAPAQAVAASTQSSLASLPPMMSGSLRLGVPAAMASVMLPLAVALFRIAAPASIVIVTLTLGRLTGTELGPAQIAVVLLLATLNTLVIAGLPNQITFFAAYAPPALAAGVPIELLPIFLAVDTIPDIFYTVTNVTADLAITSALGGEREEPAVEARESAA